MKHCSVKAKVFSWTILWKWYLMLKVSYNTFPGNLVNKADGTVKYFNSVYCNNCLYSSEIYPKSLQRHCQHEKFVTTFWMFGEKCGNFQYSVWIDIVDIGLLTINSYRVSSVNVLDIIVFAIVCIKVVVSICERLCV